MYGDVPNSNIITAVMLTGGSFYGTLCGSDTRYRILALIKGCEDS